MARRLAKIGRDLLELVRDAKTTRNDCRIAHYSFVLPHDGCRQLVMRSIRDEGAQIAKVRIKYLDTQDRKLARDGIQFRIDGGKRSLVFTTPKTEPPTRLGRYFESQEIQIEEIREATISSILRERTGLLGTLNEIEKSAARRGQNRDSTNRCLSKFQRSSDVPIRCFFEFEISRLDRHFVLRSRGSRRSCGSGQATFEVLRFTGFTSNLSFRGTEFVAGTILAFSVSGVLLA